MEKIKNSTIQNKNKIKIKTISDLQLLNLNSKKFPSFRINSHNKLRQFSFQKLKLYFEHTEKRNSTTSANKKKKGKRTIEEIEKENKELKKRIEQLEKENKKLKEENKEYKENNLIYNLNSSIKSDKINLSTNNNNISDQSYKYKTKNNYSIKFNNSLITAASKYFINLRKATLYNTDITNSIQNDHIYTSINTIEHSPKLFSNCNKLFKYNNKNSNRYGKSAITLNNIDNDFDVKIKLNNIKKRICNLFDKYVKKIEIRNN